MVTRRGSSMTMVGLMVSSLTLLLAALSSHAASNDTDTSAFAKAYAEYLEVMDKLQVVTDMSSSLQFYHASSLRMYGSQLQDLEYITASREVEQYDDITVDERRKFAETLITLGFLQSAMVKAVAESKCDGAVWGTLRTAYAYTFGSKSVQMCEEFKTCIKLGMKPMTTSTNQYVDMILQSGERAATESLAYGMYDCNRTATRLFDELAAELKAMTDVTIIQTLLKKGYEANKNWNGLKQSSAQTKLDLAEASGAAWALHPSAFGCAPKLSMYLSSNFYMGSDKPFPNGFENVIETLKSHYRTCFEISCSIVGDNAEYLQTCAGVNDTPLGASKCKSPSPEGIALAVILSLLGLALIFWATLTLCKSNRGKRQRNPSAAGIGEGLETNGANPRETSFGGAKPISPKAVHNSGNVAGVREEALAEV